MRLLPILAVAMLLCTPALAEQVAPQAQPGGSLMEQGAKLFLRGLMSEADPMLDDMGRALKDIEPALRAMGPRLQELVALMGDVTNYEAPEVMPNGDILIRRKPDAPLPPALMPKEGEIDL